MSSINTSKRKYRGHAMGQMSIFYGQRFAGFWKRADRGQQWIEIAAAVRDAANRWANALKICQLRGNPELHDELKRIIIFALARGEKHGVDWRTHPLNKMKFEDYTP